MAIPTLKDLIAAMPAKDRAELMAELNRDPSRELTPLGMGGGSGTAPAISDEELGRRLLESAWATHEADVYATNEQIRITGLAPNPLLVDLPMKTAGRPGRTRMAPKTKLPDVKWKKP